MMDLAEADIKVQEEANLAHQPKRGPGRPRKAPQDSPPLTEQTVAAASPGQVGMNVQYGYSDGRVVTAFLTRRNLVDKDVWDLAIIAPGAQTFTPRIGVKYSEQPKVGCWNFIPAEQP